MREKVCVHFKGEGSVSPKQARANPEGLLEVLRISREVIANGPSDNH